MGGREKLTLILNYDIINIKSKPSLEDQMLQKFWRKARLFQAFLMFGVLILVGTLVVVAQAEDNFVAMIIAVGTVVLVWIGVVVHEKMHHAHLLRILG